MNSQQQAALDTTVHCAVLANAGAGKTQVLVQRFLRILIVENVELESVVAITFTKAAAMEMRQRLSALIDAILSGAEDPTPYLGDLPRSQCDRRLRRIQLDIGSARISTFHSFCAGLVRQYADLVGRSSDVRDADERLSAELCHEAVDTTMQQVLGIDRLRDPRVQATFDALSISDIHATVARLTRNSADRQKVIQILNQSVDETLETRRKNIRRLQQEQLHRLVSGMIEHFAPWRHIPEIDELHGSICEVKRLLELQQQTAQQQLVSIVEGWFTQDYSIKKTRLSKESKSGVLPDALSSPLCDIADFIRTPWNDDAERQQLMVIQGLATLAQHSAHHFSEIKRKRNVLDFDDMIDDASALLSDPDVAAAIRSSISYIMIDEFQDTDPTQFRLLELLAPVLSDGASEGPNVFVVGDDKQSIYGFRNADVRLFRRARRAISRANESIDPADNGLRPLTQSYRMHQHLVEGINEICRHAFGAVPAPDEDDDVSYDVAYMELTAAIERQHDPSISSLRLVSIAADELSTPTEFDYVSRHITDMLDGDVPANVFEKTVPSRKARPGDIAILVPSNEAKGLVAESLRRHGLPFTVYSGRSFFSRPEVADIRAMLRAATDPRDDLATATAMRSPLLRCPDADIVRASLQGRKSSLQDGLERLVSSGQASTESADALSAFESVRTMITLQPISEVIPLLLDRCQWHRAVAADRRYPQMLANIEKLIDLCMKVEQNRSASLTDVLHAISEPERDLEAEGTVMSNEDAIHVMTIHASKGLEFPIVVLAGLNASSRLDSLMLSEQIGPTIGLPAKVVLPGDPLLPVSRPSSLSHTANGIIGKGRIEAEQRRLLYVALTRAKAHLVVTIPSKDTTGNARGLARLVADATKGAGPWRHVDTSSQNTSEMRLGSLHTSAVLTAPFAALDPPERVLLTASQLNRQAGVSVAATRRRLTNHETSSTIYGTAIHEALASVIRTAHQDNSDDVIRRVVSVMKRYELDRERSTQATTEVLAVLGSPLIADAAERLSTAIIEGSLTALYHGTVVEGVIDVRLSAADGSVEIWDWKTNHLRSEHHLEEVAQSYSVQMQTYAWLCMQALAGCNKVTTRLIFTKAALQGFPSVHVQQQWDRSNLSLLFAE